MPEIKITIENCNNISKGVISLEEEKLNIRYGMNGTGKSTLSTAISLFSQGKPMDELKPFGSDDEIIPTISIDGDIQGVRVFNEEFVNNMVFKESICIKLRWKSMTKRYALLGNMTWMPCTGPYVIRLPGVILRNGRRITTN